MPHKLLHRPDFAPVQCFQRNVFDRFWHGPFKMLTETTEGTYQRVSPSAGIWPLRKSVNAFFAKHAEEVLLAYVSFAFCDPVVRTVTEAKARSKEVYLISGFEFVLRCS